MDHLEIATQHSNRAVRSEKGLQRRAAGRFYTHELVGKFLAERWFLQHQNWLKSAKTVKACDPFCGDGRLICWILEEASKAQISPLWEIEIWDIDAEAIVIAESAIIETAKRVGATAVVHHRIGDAFKRAIGFEEYFDLVVTNPPWELLKPDSRELRHLPSSAQSDYVAALRRVDTFLAEQYPISQPAKKFAGWGTNLARAGIELSVRITRLGGAACIVCPPSFFADGMSYPLRRWLFTETSLVVAAYFPAELRLFRTADVTAAAFIAQRKPTDKQTFEIVTFGLSGSREAASHSFPVTELASRDFLVPISFGSGLFEMINALAHLPKFADLEKDGGLWAGREVDETRIDNWLDATIGAPFVKGRMVDRYRVVEEPSRKLRRERYEKLRSVHSRRIVWRDVSRPNQKRRMIATIIPSGWVTGNSLGVAYFSEPNNQRLSALLGIMNSLPFELQLRARLATGHVSLTALREVRIPDLEDNPAIGLLSDYVDRVLAGNVNATPYIEAAAAHAYGLSLPQYEQIMAEFPKLSGEECRSMIEAFRFVAMSLKKDGERRNGNRLANHYSAKLSDLDVQTALAIPPGGNWKNVPVTIPLKRLQTIRESFARGEGSRSTYYGRLHPDRPAYTINTYFSRPGNGCHLHYDFAGEQHRVISQREAARLQTFPDDFVFHGSKVSINQQIGNAVPPLLAYRVAQQLPRIGCFVDLFAGAGGFGLGFKWAGWQPLIANDVEPHFLSTYKANVHSNVLLGDIRSTDVLAQLVSRVRSLRSRFPTLPLWVLGGPPCQGFSTAGKRRSLSDDRNHLFRSYIHVLDELKPDGFVFENVTGLLNMEGGTVFRALAEAFRPYAERFYHWLLAAEDHAIPQRRTRILLIGMNGREERPLVAPRVITAAPGKIGLFGGSVPWVTVQEAIADLPSLKSGQDGSHLSYASEPWSAYQALMRSLIEPGEYLDLMSSNARSWPNIASAARA